MVAFSARKEKGTFLFSAPKTRFAVRTAGKKTGMPPFPLFFIFLPPIFLPATPREQLPERLDQEERAKKWMAEK